MQCLRVLAGLWLFLGGLAEAQITLREALSRHAVVRAAVSHPDEALPIAPPATITEALSRAAAQAEIIFLGEVTSVERQGNAVRVSFRVDSAVRGVKAGQTYSMREWAGLGADGESRYRKGQRMLVMLHSPSAAGFTSPIGGAEGLLPMRGDAVTGSLDLRWLMTGIVRSPAAGTAAPPPMQSSFDTGHPAAGRSFHGPDAVARSVTDPNLPEPDSLDSALVLEMLRALTARPTPARIH